LSNLIQAKQLDISSLLELLSMSNIEINGKQVTLNDFITSLQNTDRDLEIRISNIENSGVITPSNPGNGIISSVDTTYFKIITDSENNDKKLTLLDIDQSKIVGLTDVNDNVITLAGCLDNKVDKVDGMGLSEVNFTTELFNKLNGIDLNIIKGIKIDSTLLTIDEDRNVEIPIASESTFGVVKGSTDENRVNVSANGTMYVNSLNVNKLVQSENDTLILNCGTSDNINKNNL